MPGVLQFLLHVPGPVVLGVVGALVFGEAAFFLGVVLPGETAALLGGFLSSAGKLSVVLLGVVVVLAAVAGDSVGYEVGKRLGPRMLVREGRALAGHRRCGRRSPPRRGRPRRLAPPPPSGVVEQPGGRARRGHSDGKLSGFWAVSGASAAGVPV